MYTAYPLPHGYEVSTLSHSANRLRTRQIRRAFGADALEAITARDDALKAVQLVQATQGERLDLIESHTRQHQQLLVLHETWRRQSFRDRMRWLFQGVR